jgi:hypothetical protein
MSQPPSVLTAPHLWDLAREVEHTLEVPSVEAFWIALARGTPPIHAVPEHLGPERVEQ